ncbi:MAG: alpha/beta fold hydrolase, partial [Pseudomonadota bacterium]
VPEFKAIMESMREPANDRKANPTFMDQPADRPTHPETDDIFFLDVEGQVSEITPELAHALSLQIGDQLTLEGFEITPEGEPLAAMMIEVADAVGIMRRLIVHKIGEDQRAYSAQFVRARLSPGFRLHLKSQFDLTPSELDILQLCLRRYRLDQIAMYRNNSLNTVRTHISRILKKLDCNSVTEALASLVELSLAYNADVSMPPDLHGRTAKRTYTLKLPGQAATVEYARYGPASGKPVIILHSTEYGYAPPLDFIEAARARNLCLYFPLRPGYGQTTPADSLEAAAQRLEDFVHTLNLKHNIVVGLSTAAPLALNMSAKKADIERMLLINYGLNAESKVDTIRPVWVRGLVKMAIESKTSFKLGQGAVKGLLKTFGTERFYRLLYSGLPSDSKFYEANFDVFERARTYLLSARNENVHLDLVSAFTKFPNLAVLLAKQKDVLVANGALQHYVDPTEAIESAAKLGVTLKLVPNGGRNWLFDDPAYFFDFILDSARVEAG